MRSLAALAAVLAGLLAGCGDESSETASKTTAAGSAARAEVPERVHNLLRRVPESTYLIEVTDWLRARRELRVHERLDPADYEGRTGPEGDFDAAALPTAPHVVGGFASPAAEAIDHGLVTAGVAATTLDDKLEDPLVLLATEEPLRRIQRGLRRAGYRDYRRGWLYLHRAVDLDTGELTEQITYPVVGVVKGGIVLGDNVEAVARAFDRPPPATGEVKTLLEVLGRVDGAHRTAESFASRRSDPTCVSAIAGSEDFRDRTDDLVLRVSGRATSSSVKLGIDPPDDETRASLASGYKTADIEAKGSEVRMTVTTARDEISSKNAASVVKALEPDDMYNCS